MLTKTLHTYIDSIYGLDRRALDREYPEKDDDGNTIGIFWLEYYWIAEVDSSVFPSSPIDPFEPLVLAVMKSTRWTRGLILIPPMRRDEERPYGGPLPLKPVELVHWKDPVAGALNQVALFPTESPALADNDETWEYGLEFATLSVRGSLRVQTTRHAPRLEALWTALRQTTDHIVGLYNHPEINAYVGR